MTQRKIIGFAVLVPTTLIGLLLIWAVIQNDGNPGGLAVNQTLGERDVPGACSFISGPRGVRPVGRKARLWKQPTKIFAILESRL